MGLETHDSKKKTYINIVGGKFATKADEGAEGAVSRVNKNNKTVFEFLHDRLSGTIESIIVQKNEKLGAYEYVIDVNDVGTHYSVSVPAESKYGDSLASKVPNIAINVWTTLQPYDFEDKTKINPNTGKPQKQTGISIIQNEVKIASAYTKENPNGLPQMEGKLDEEEYKIFKIQQRKFFRNMVETLALNRETSAMKKDSYKDIPAASSINPDFEDTPF